MTRTYLPLLQSLDHWQAAARIDHPGVVPCRRGCAACCHGPFDISAADAAMIVEAVDRLPAPARLQVIDRAAAQITAMRALEPTWERPFAIASIGDERFDHLSETLADAPCPLLDSSGGCLVYAERPMVCRLIGLGLISETGDLIENECPIRHEYPRYAELAPRPFPLEAWCATEDRANRAAAERLFGDAAQWEYETTVAGAIVAMIGA